MTSNPYEQQNASGWANRTVKEAKEYLRREYTNPNGARCPCCGQKVKLYPRKLSSHMARGLIEIYRFTEREKPKDGWIHVGEHYQEFQAGFSGGDYAKLRYWGLIEADGEECDPDKSSTGNWRITDKGKNFVEGKIRVPKIAFVYNNRCRRMSDTMLSISEALGEKFSYQELMGAVPAESDGKQSEMF